MITFTILSIYAVFSSIEKTYPTSNIFAFFEVKSAVPLSSNIKFTR